MTQHDPDDSVRLPVPRVAGERLRGERLRVYALEAVILGGLVLLVAAVLRWI